MKVTKVSCEVKFSKAVNKGAWKTISLGAEAALNGKEGCKKAQATLYAEVPKLNGQVFTNGPQEASEKPTDPSWCPIHKVEDEVPREEWPSLVLPQDEGRLVSRAGRTQRYS